MNSLNQKLISGLNNVCHLSGREGKEVEPILDALPGLEQLVPSQPLCLYQLLKFIVSWPFVTLLNVSN
jgi:hypothetical protein